MSRDFESIKKKYAESFELHGDSPAALLSPKGKHALRFRAIDQFLSEGSSILDYGCGLGYLHEYLMKKNTAFDYTGVDILPEFIATCRDKYPSVPFFDIEPGEGLTEKYDIIFSSGVFNIRSNPDAELSKNYAFDRMRQLYDATGRVLICDFLSENVDFKQDGAQHFSVGELADFCFKNLSRRFQIRHDLLPYELTVIVFKEGEVLHPENIYEADLCKP